MKSFVAVIFLLVVLGAFSASIWYVAFRLRTLLGLKRRKPLRIAVAAGFIASLVAMLSGPRSASTLVGALGTLGGYVFSSLVFLTLLLLVFHALQLKLKLRPKWIVTLALVMALGITTAGGLWANPFRVSEIEISLDGLRRDVVVMHISDVHIGHHRGRAYLARIVAETNRQRPDIVLINGDLVDSNVALRPGVLSPLSDLDAPAFFVGGNHESYVDTERAFELVSKYGVRVLHNEVVDTHGIYLVGLDYMNPDENTFDMHPSRDKRTIKSVLPTLALAGDKPSVLMHHNPVGAQYVAAKGVDLMVSGHTHAGQMFPATLLAPVIFPFHRGLCDEGDMQVFVSQGAGTFGPRIRLGTSNEINLLRLKAAKWERRALSDSPPRK